MSSFKFYALGKNRRQKQYYVKILFCVFFTLMFTLPFLNYYFYSDKETDYDEHINNINDNISNFDQYDLDIATDISMLQNPFTKNSDLLRIFFQNNYKSSLDLDIILYFRNGDENGTIIDDTIYSEDNLLMYNSLMNTGLDPTETFNIYLKLRSSPLWYENDNNQFNYGFVNSIYNSTGKVKNDKRYLIDNLLPIFLLIENIGNDIDKISINGESPKDAIEEMFFLINSTEFWDENYDGFSNSNSTTDKYSKSNFYSILANLLIHRTYHLFDINDPNDIIKNTAYDLANKTISAMIYDDHMWNNDDKAFRYSANNKWNPFGVGGNVRYHLDVNALGIITLLEFWVESGMESDSPFLKKAIDLYNSLNANLWNKTGNDLYSNIADPSWFDYDNSTNLNSNALMLEACIRLFQLTGNITYYQRAIVIFNKFNNDITGLYDNINKAYNFSPSNNSKNFNANLKLYDAYMRASETWSSTKLEANYNITDSVPDFVFNQDILNLTSVYAFKNIEYYYNLSIDSYVPFTVRYNITDADINYLFKYPNGSFLIHFENQIISPVDSHTLIYAIEENLPIGEGYYIYVWANKTNFNVADTIKRFNVNSGLINETIEGLVSFLYQGPFLNITLPINYTRRDNLTLTASLEGADIINFPAQEVNFTATTELEDLTYIEFNLTAKLGANPGPSKITFKITKGNILYLEIKKIIEIGYSFDYKHLLYQSKIVSGENFNIFLDLINYLPNAKQSLNISFSDITENSIENFIQEVTLEKNEIRSISFNLRTLENIEKDIISLEMNILQNTTIYYTEELTLEIIPKFDIISVSFPRSISQGVPAYFIATIKSNLEDPEGFSLYINGELVQTNINELIPGENRIEKKIIPTNNPYEFGIKKYRIIIEDSDEEEIARFYFTISLELSTFNLIIFYIIPVIIPIGIVLYFL
ncbi:MAG: hypothetical protein ACFFG0_40625, partial [Candidatus Thorarchaeota archaeon]